MAKTQNYDAKLEALVRQPADITKTSLVQLVKRSDTSTVHSAFIRIREFFKMFEQEVKAEFVKRSKKARDNNAKLVTDDGEIVYACRDNLKYDSDGLLKLAKKKRIPIDDIFDRSYEVVTKSPKALKSLVDKGLIKEVLKPNKKKVLSTMETYPEVSKLVEVTKTEYIIGL